MYNINQRGYAENQKGSLKLSKQFKKKQYPVIILKITGEKHNAEIL